MTKRILMTLLLAIPFAADGFSTHGMTNMRTPFASMVVMRAQKMTPTRKTRRDDSFDRSSGDEEKEEEAGESSGGWGSDCWGRMFLLLLLRVGLAVKIILSVFILFSLMAVLSECLECHTWCVMSRSFHVRGG
jgi:hypothetical protein